MAHSANYFDVSEQGGIQVIRVKGERLRDAEILALVELIQEAAEAGKSEAVALDLSAVDLMSSVAVSLLFRLSTERPIRIVGLQPRVAEALGLLGILPTLECDATVADAIAGFARAERDAK